MIPRLVLGRATVPGGGELRLIRRGDEFSITLLNNELMNSRLSGSEEALATLACAVIGDRPRAQMLVGGLGMGFTVRAALDRLAADAVVTVAEIVPAVIAWAHGPLAPVFGTSLADPRVDMREADVVDLIAAAHVRYDAILLDVDNGPEGLSRAGNDRLYGDRGLAAAMRALRPGGVLAIWSSGPNAAFARRLNEAGFAVDATVVRANAGRNGARHVIWTAVKRG